MHANSVQWIFFDPMPPTTAGYARSARTHASLYFTPSIILILLCTSRWTERYNSTVGYCKQRSRAKTRNLTKRIISFSESQETLLHHQWLAYSFGGLIIIIIISSRYFNSIAIISIEVDPTPHGVIGATGNAFAIGRKLLHSIDRSDWESYCGGGGK